MTDILQVVEKRNSTTGDFAKEARAFAHQAKAVVIGAVNNTWYDKGIKMTSGGSGYSAGDVIILTTTGGAGDAAEVTVVEADDSGTVTNYKVSTVGAGYAVGDTETDAAGSGFACTITNIDIPNTASRGCCLYVGGEAAQDITVIMEQERYDGNGSQGYGSVTRSVTFTGVPAGVFLPIQIVQVVTGSDLLALY